MPDQMFCCFASFPYLDLLSTNVFWKRLHEFCLEVLMSADLVYYEDFFKIWIIDLIAYFAVTISLHFTVLYMNPKFVFLF